MMEDQKEYLKKNGWQHDETNDTWRHPSTPAAVYTFKAALAIEKSHERDTIKREWVRDSGQD